MNNTYTTDEQYYPAVAGSGAGDFVVVWMSYDQAPDAGRLEGEMTAFLRWFESRTNLDLRKP